MTSRPRRSLPTGAKSLRTRPGTQRILPAVSTTGHPARSILGTLASTNTSWSFFEPPRPSGRIRSPGFALRTVSVASSSARASKTALHGPGFAPSRTARARSRQPWTATSPPASSVPTNRREPGAASLHHSMPPLRSTEPPGSARRFSSPPTVASSRTRSTCSSSMARTSPRLEPSQLRTTRRCSAAGSEARPAQSRLPRTIRRCARRPARRSSTRSSSRARSAKRPSAALMAGLNSLSSSGRTPRRIRFRVNRRPSLLRSVRWRKPRRRRNSSTSRRDTSSSGRTIPSARSGWMPPSPPRPLPRISRWRTVSA
jgi:hypothetical protein